MPLLDCLPQPLTGETLILVIAHPDDEAMFFYPTISRAKRLRIICLSNGGYDGLGEQREEELQRAARRLGASATCINNAASKTGRTPGIQASWRRTWGRGCTPARSS